ncbi:hypothetical protein C0991_011988 [Blastosporella zonata]|nr:hypothetical protein C0991_011988 [Blastosporella zonata]
MTVPSGDMGRVKSPAQSSYKTALLVIVLFIWGALFFLFGGVGYRWASEDPRDPHVREGELRRWRRDVDNLQQLHSHYQQQASMWKNRSEHFEDEWNAKLAHEEAERQRAGLYWGEFIGDDHCVSSGRKAYRARLMNLTPALPAIISCHSTIATINGVTYDRPLYCENKGMEGVIGHWITENEAICSTYWEFVRRKDCSAPGSGKRRYEAKFGSVHNGEDPETLCLGTPITIYGQLFERPLACPNRGSKSWEGSEYWGVWDVPVGDCS